MKPRNDTVLLLDDEPEYLTWLEEYVSKKGYKTRLVRDLNEAEDELRQWRFRFAIIDLNVPAAGTARAHVDSIDELHRRFPGLYAAELARNLGYRARQIVVYSVHESEEVAVLSRRIGFTYITKGRPRAFKEEVDAILSYDPTVDRDHQGRVADR
jgi:CheY-like chemotaxis protein